MEQNNSYIYFYLINKNTQYLIIMQRYDFIQIVFRFIYLKNISIKSIKFIYLTMDQIVQKIGTDIFIKDIQSLKMIMIIGQLDFDVSELQTALMNDQDHQKISILYKACLSAQQHEKLQRFLGSKLLKDWAEKKYIQDSHSIEIVPQRKEKQFASSSSKVEIQIKKYFSHIKEDTSKLQECILNNVNYQSVLKQLYISLPGKIYKQIYSVIQSVEFKQLQKKILNENNDNIYQKIKQIFSKHNFNVDVEELIQALVKDQSLQQLMWLYRQDLTGKQYRQLNSILQSSELKNLLKKQEKSLKKQINKLFENIKFNIDKLKELLINKEQIPIEILQYYQDELTGSQYRQLIKILQSQQFKKLIHQSQGKDHQFQKEIATLKKLLTFAPEKSIKIIQQILKQNQTSYILQKYIQKLSKMQILMLHNFFEGQQFKNVKNSLQQKLKKCQKTKKKETVQECIKNMFYQKGLKSDMTKFIDKFVNGYPYSICLQQSGIIKEENDSKTLEVLQNSDELKQIQEKFFIKNQIKEQSQALDQILKPHLLNNFENIKQLVLRQKSIQIITKQMQQKILYKQWKKLSQISKQQRFIIIKTSLFKKSQNRRKSKQLKTFFYEKGIKTNINRFSQALINNQNILPTIIDFYNNLPKAQLDLLKQCLLSQQIELICAFIYKKQMKKIEYLTMAFIKQNITANASQIIENLALGQDYQKILNQLKIKCKQKEIYKISSLLCSKELQFQLKKIDTHNYQQKFNQLNKIIQEISMKEKIIDHIIIEMPIDTIFEQISFIQPTEKMLSLNQDLLSQQMSSLIKSLQIQNLKYKKKIQVSLKKNKIVFVNQGQKVKEIMKKYELKREQSLFLTLNSQILQEENEIKQPIQLYKSAQFKVNFQNIQNIMLPLIKVSRIIQILQKKLKTNLKLQIAILGNDNSFNQVKKDFDFLEYIQRVIKVYYHVTLKFTISNDTNFKIKECMSNESVNYIQKNIQNQIGLKKQNQKWLLQGKQIKQTKKTIQQLQIRQPVEEIHIQEIKNLEFYGFQQVKDIKKSLFKDFYIEDDEQFIENIKKSNFPEKDYSQIFKNQILGYIFSAIKKHTPIKTAIKHIQSLVEKCNKQQSLWKPKNSHEKRYFNETYVLYHILKCSNRQLKTQIIRLLMVNMPIPFSFRQSDGSSHYLYHEHYWIQNKAFNIASLGYQDNVLGKSKLLNIIFEVNFPDRHLIHKQCQDGIQVQYNIYQNDEYSVNLIDISSSINEKKKIQIACNCNLLIIHHKVSENIVQEWINSNKLDCPVILIQRDVENALQKQNINQRNQQKIQNQYNTKINKYKIMKINDDNTIFFNRQINQIANGIQQFVRKRFEDISMEPQHLWKFSDYMAQNIGTQYEQFNKILKQIEYTNQDLTIITNIFNDYRINQSEISNENEKDITEINYKLKQKALKIGLAEPLQQIIYFCINNLQLSSLIMSKLRKYLTILRNDMFKDFNSLQNLSKKADKKKEKYFNQLKNELLLKIKNINQLKESLTSSTVQQYCTKFINEIESFKDAKDWQAIIKKIKIQFEFQIQPRAFSLENFWRQIIYMTKFDPNYTFKINNKQIHLKNSIISLAQKQIQDSQNFEIINGDLLEMPMQFVNSIFDNQKEKKVMVVAVLGPQSSGKSTILNYALGCDFMSSAGRCTKGIYGTYFQISNKQFPNCQAILVLDTEGLFSNYNNDKFSNRKGFDNKLVLFCLQVCDIIILNTKGDVTKECQDILEIAFDSEGIDPKNLPQIYFVLNFNGGQINSTQSREIQKFCDVIIKTNIDAKKILKSENSIGLPMAFNQIPRKSTATYITNYLKPKMQPSERFYNQTKKFSFEIMRMIQQRGSQKIQGRMLQQALVLMDQAWSTINKYPILTKHGNKMLKNQQQKINIWIKQKNQQFLNRQKSITNQIASISIDSLQQWKKEKEKQIKLDIEKALEDYNTRFLEKDGEVIFNNLIKQMRHKVQGQLDGFIMKLGVLYEQKKYQKQIQQLQLKGFDTINVQIKKIKLQNTKQKKSIEQQDLEERFQKCWNLISSQMMKQFDRKKHSQDIYSTLLQIYNNTLQQQKTKSLISLKNKNMSSIQRKQFFEFEKQLTRQFINNFKENYIFESSNQKPIMNIQKKVGDLTFKYLDMSNYIKRKQICKYNLINILQLQKSLNLSEIKLYVQSQLDKKKTTISNFINDLYDDLIKIGVTFKKKKLIEFTQRHFKDGFFYKIAKIIEYKTILCQNKDLQDLQYQIYRDYQNPININYKRYKAKKWVKYIKNQQKDHDYSKLKYLNYINVNNEARQQLHKKPDSFNYYTYYGLGRIVCILTSRIIQKQTSRITQLMNQQKQTLINQICRRIKNDLNKINLDVHEQYIKQILQQGDKDKTTSFFIIDSNYEFINQQIINKPFESFSRFWHRQKLKKLIKRKRFQQLRYKQTYQQTIGYNKTYQISILEKYQKHKILQKYIDKEHTQFIQQMRKSDFKKFIKEQLNYKNALQELCEKAQSHKIGGMDLKKAVNIMVNEVHSILQQINKDLKQVSQKLTYNFAAELHQYTFKIIWKLKDEHQWGEKEKILNDFCDKKEGQRKRFKQMTSGKPIEENQACAEKILDFYISFINKEIISKKKKEHSSQSRNSYKQLYSRNKVQFMIDRSLHNSNQSQQILDYLLNPVNYTKNFYQKLQNKEIKKFVDYKYDDHIILINDFSKCVNQFRDYCEQEQKCIGQEIFEGIISDSKDQNFIHLFVEVLLKEKGVYVDNKNQIGLKIKEGRRFMVKQILSIYQNRLFIGKLKQSGIIITNLKLFLNFLSDKLKYLHTKSNQILNLQFNSEEIASYQNSLRVNICNHLCPCCKRNCDVDLQFDLNHKIHKCSFGHQMRAIGGMRIQYYKHNINRYKSSIQRCEDIQQDFLFQFNDKIYKWSAFKLQKKQEWDFDHSQNSNNELYFRHYWQKAGKLICQYYANNDNIPMAYVPYEANEIAQQKQHQLKYKPNNYIFALDQSYSMEGDCWNQLVDAMKKNIIQISNINKQNNQYISIFKFSQKTKLIIQGGKPINFNINSLIYQGGLTKFIPLFKTANQIMKRQSMLHNIFILISDGYGEYPQQEIKIMKSFKEKQKQNFLNVDYVSILIGSGNPPVMEQIRSELDGRHNTIANVNSFTQIFKQIMPQKKLSQ